MKLGEFIDRHYGEYARIGSKAGWFWIGYINANTIDDVNRHLENWRLKQNNKLVKYQKDLKKLKSGKNKTLIKSTETRIKRLEEELLEPWIPAYKRKIKEHSMSNVDGAHLVKIEGYETGNKLEFREQEQKKIIPDECYMKFAGEILKANVEDLKEAMLIIFLDDQAYYSVMIAPQKKQKKGRIYSAKRIAAEDLLLQREQFFRNDFYEVLCPNISYEDVMEMTEKAVYKKAMEIWKAKAESYEEWIHENRESDY